MTTQTPITVFNRRLGADRREVYFPTTIQGASFAAAAGSTRSDGTRSQDLAYKLRVPAGAAFQDCRTFTPEANYQRLSDEEAARCWTLQLDDLIIPEALDLQGPLADAEVRALAASSCLITVKEYAVNTGRGSRAVQHYRIGGE